MSFGGLSQGRSGALPYSNASMTAGEISPPHLVSQRLIQKPTFTSAALSLGLVYTRISDDAHPILIFLSRLIIICFLVSNSTMSN